MSNDGFDITTDEWADCPEIHGWKIRTHLREDGERLVGIWNGEPGDDAVRFAVCTKGVTDADEAIKRAMPSLDDMADEHARKKAGVPWMEWLERKFAQAA